MRFRGILRLRKYWLSSSRVRFFEAAASVLLFGALAQRPDLQSAADKALRQLEARGYTVSGEPIRVYPIQTDASKMVTGAHAGTWRPGVINLRENPAAGPDSEAYLRHELFHEVSHRTCQDKLPIWVEEAGAIAFSGESQSSAPSSESDLVALKQLIARDAALDTRSYRTLLGLVSQHGWPEQPCHSDSTLLDILGNPEEFGSLDYVLINLASARVLEARGAGGRAAPPGSLLKLLYAAALRNPDASLASDLARSDTKAMLKRQADFKADRYRQLFPQASSLLADVVTGSGEVNSALLGERSPDGTYPLELTLESLSHLVRTAILIDPRRFAGLKANGFLADTTLVHADSAALEILAGMKAWAKTGTASNSHGKPLVGHLVVVWPANDPKYLAVFRGADARGAGVLARAREVLHRWGKEYSVARATVRVSILSLLKRDEFSVSTECPRFSQEGLAHQVSFSTCGHFTIKTNALGAKSERRLSGMIEDSPDRLILITDPESYADGVLASEAADLHGSARAALRAVIVWDGLHGWSRHNQTPSLCDSTHCMVFMGDATAQPHTEPQLLDLLDKFAAEQKVKWFHFSRGGNEKWSIEFTGAHLAKFLNESLVLSVQRERNRSGAVDFHLVYNDGEETVGCEVLRRALKLPSCPTAVMAQDDKWIFSGQGKGHGLGLDVEAARMAARQGDSAREILEKAFSRVE